jgi:hypothetical protein
MPPLNAMDCLLKIHNGGHADTPISKLNNTRFLVDILSSSLQIQIVPKLKIRCCPIEKKKISNPSSKTSNHRYWRLLNWEREGASPLGNLLSESQNLRHGIAGNLCLEVLELVSLLWKFGLLALADLNCLVNVSCNTLEVGFTQSTAGHSGSANADTAWGEGGLVTRDGVLVACNVDLFKDGLNSGTIKGKWTQVKEDHVAVGSVGYELMIELLEFLFECLGILDDLFLVLLEFWSCGLLESNC